MKLIFFLLVAVATVSPAVIHSIPRTPRSTIIRLPRPTEKTTEEYLDVLARYDEPPAELKAKLDESLDRMEPQLAKLREMKPEMRALIRRVALVVVDFELPTEQRIMMVTPILDQADLTEEEYATFRMLSIMGIAMTEPIHKKMPVTGKVLGTVVVETMLSDDFLFGSRKTRRAMAWKMGHKFAFQMASNADMVKEAKQLELDQEVKDMKKKIGILDF